MTMKIWGMPILLGLLSGFGLVSALLEDGMWDLLSWLALGIPTALIAWYWLRPVRR
jgi:NADH:ubiquinone oxidoreductase subunit 2 (subunit N)